MNRKQKILGYLAILLFFISVLLSPWRLDYVYPDDGRIRLSYVLYHPVFSVPTGDQPVFRAVSTLLWQPLLFTWIAIVVCYAGLFFLVRAKRE